MKFQGKIDVWWYFVLIFFNVIFVFALCSSNKTGGIAGLFIAFLLWVVCDIFMFQVTFKNYVYLDEEELIIFFGPIKQRIRNNEILSVSSTHNPLSSMAISLDRIRIQWIHGSVFIAVKEKQTFIHQLCLKNPNINVLKR